MRGDNLRAADQTPAFAARFLCTVQALRAGHELAAGGPMPRPVRVLLAIEPGRIVPTRRLIEESLAVPAEVAGGADLLTELIRLFDAGLTIAAALAALKAGTCIGPVDMAPAGVAYVHPLEPR